MSTAACNLGGSERQVVTRRLTAIGRTQRRWARRAQLVGAAGRWLGVWLLWLLVDAVWPLAWWVRLGVLVVMVLAAAAWLARQRRGAQAATNQRQALLAAARRAERLMGASGNPLVNAVSLTGADEPMTRTLAGRASAAGARALAEAHADWAINEKRALRQAGGTLWLAAVGWVVTAVIWPGLIGGGMVRFGLPWIDQPWFSLSRIGVTVSPPQPAVGADATVTVATTGRPVAAATLLTLNNVGQVTGRWPMRATGDRRFARKLVGVRQAMRIQVRAGGARSRIITVQPRQTASRAARPTLKHAGASGKVGKAHSRGTMRHAHGAAATQGGLNLGQALDNLRAQAQAIAKQARADHGQAGGAQALVAAIKRFRAAAGRLKNAGGAPVAIRMTLANRVAILNLMRIKFPTQVSASGAGKATNGSAKGWAQAVARGAKADARALAGLMMVIGANPAKTASARRRASGGVYHERASAGGRHEAAVQALVDEAPPAYRAQVRNYFQRLAQDANRPDKP